jgi:hypothetical protein
MKKITMLMAFLLAFATESYAQFPQGFEGTTFPPTGWASFIGTNGLGTAQNWQRTTAVFATGTACAYVSYDGADPGQPKEDWLVTPQFTPTAATSSLTFAQRQQYSVDYGSSYTIRVSTTSQTSHAAFTTILTQTEADFGLAFGPKQVDLSAYIGTPIYVAFVMTNDDGDSWLIDDVNLSSSVTAPGCVSNPSPADMAVDVAVGQVTFSWDVPTTGGPATSYDLFAGDAPGNVTTLVGNFPTNTITLGLNAFDTLIYWKVVAKNAGGSAIGCAEWSFTTQSPPGYCLNAPFGQYPTAAAGFTPTNCDGVEVNEILTNGYAGEYSLVNVTAGQTYTFTSGTSDFITIGSTTANAALAYGQTPLTWVSTVDGQIKFFSHLDNFCGEEAVNRTRGVICGIPAADLPDYANLQYPATVTIAQGETVTVYGQVYEPGVTEAAGQGTGIQAWVGVSDMNSNPNAWAETSWIPATYNAGAAAGNNDEYMTEIGTGLVAGTYYYATRFRLNAGAYVYGGTDGTNGNFWDGATYNSGELTVTPPPAPANDECTGAIALTPGGDFAAGAMATTNFGATTDALVPSCQALSGENVWYTVVVPASGNITIETAEVVGSDFDDSVITVFSGDCAVLTPIECDDDTTGLYSTVALTGRTPGEVLYVSVWRYNGGDGAYGPFQISAYDASLATDQFSQNNFTYFPNPVKNVLNLSHTQNISSVAVYNLLGQQILAKTVNNAQSQIDMSDLAAGTYMVKVVAGNQTKTIKVVKQ